MGPIIVDQKHGTGPGPSLRVGFRSHPVRVGWDRFTAGPGRVARTLPALACVDLLDLAELRGGPLVCLDRQGLFLRPLDSAALQPGVDHLAELRPRALTSWPCERSQPTGPALRWPGPHPGRKAPRRAQEAQEGPPGCARGPRQPPCGLRGPALRSWTTGPRAGR